MTNLPRPGTPAGRDEAGPREMAFRGMHGRVVEIVRREVAPAPEVRALDVGAGEGSLAAMLSREGYAVSACDAFPEIFRVDGIECRRVDAAGRLPYEEGSFDLVVSIEVVEHLESHRRMFEEVRRVLAPGGAFVFSTPNILSLKSRVRFLFTGYPYAFEPLDPSVDDPVSQHITAFSLDRYRFMLARCGLDLTSVSTDKLQRSSLALGWLAPAVRFFAARTFGRSDGVREQNSRVALFGRTLFAVARKRAAGRS